MKTINKEWLLRRHACDKAIKNFTRNFGDRAKVDYNTFFKWRDTRRFWRQDFDWLFFEIAYTKDDFRERVADNLCEYMNIPKPSLYFTSDWNLKSPIWRFALKQIWDKLYKLDRDRLVIAMTQIVYMTK